MNPRVLSGAFFVVVVIVLVGARFYSASTQIQANSTAEKASYEEHKAKMRAVLAGVASNPKLRDAAKDVKADAKYIDAIFDQVHDQAWEGAVSYGRRGSFTVSEYGYMDGFFKTLSARALADKKNELSGAIDRVNLYTPKSDTTGWEPLPGSNPRPRR
jgi:hypothetical protein